MKKIDMAVPTAPTHVKVGVTALGVIANLRVVDVATGKTIDGVIEADAAAGKLLRYEVEDGNLVRAGDSFKTVDEQREIRIEWIDPAVVDATEEGVA